MPRNGEGVYSLPQAAFVPGTTISSAAVNSDFSDIASALTMSIASDGQTPITGALRTSVSSPTPAFTSIADDTTGLVVGTATAGIAVSGTETVVWTASGEVLTGTLSVSSDTSVGGNLAVTGNMTIGGTFSFTGTAGIEIPDGTTGQRPGSPVAETIRFNSTLDSYEGFDGTEWQAMSFVPSAYTISTSVNAGILTVNLLNARTGVAATAADPFILTFRDATIANGDPVSVTINSALTLTTNATGATLGTSNNVAFRFWLVAFNNGGTVVLALINCLTATEIFPLIESQLASATGISNGATSAGIFYCPNGTTITSMPFKILGFIEYSSGLATAGTYSAQPSQIQIFGPGIPRPGQPVQLVVALPAFTDSVSGDPPHRARQAQSHLNRQPIQSSCSSRVHMARVPLVRALSLFHCYAMVRQVLHRLHRLGVPIPFRWPHSTNQIL